MSLKKDTPRSMEPVVAINSYDPQNIPWVKFLGRCLHLGKREIDCIRNLKSGWAENNLLTDFYLVERINVLRNPDHRAVARSAVFAERDSDMRPFITCSILCFACLGTPLASFAQFGNSGGGGGGGIGGGRGGGGGGGAGFGGAGGGAGGGFGGGGMGAGGLGGAGGGLGGGLGSGAGGGLGGGGLGGGGAFGQGGMNNGQNAMGQQGQGFLGRNTNANNFLGRNVQGQGQNGMMNQNGGNRRGGNNRGNQNGMMNQQQQGGMGVGFGGAQRQAPVIRPRQKVAFDHTPPHLPTVSTKLETRLNKMTALKSSNVKLSVGGEGEVVLTGRVASAERAKVAEIIARQEPGVRSVRNELTYPDAPTAQ